MSQTQQMLARTLTRWLDGDDHVLDVIACMERFIREVTEEKSEPPRVNGELTISEDDIWEFDNFFGRTNYVRVLGFDSLGVIVATVRYQGPGRYVIPITGKFRTIALSNFRKYFRLKQRKAHI